MDNENPIVDKKFEVLFLTTYGNRRFMRTIELPIEPKLGVNYYSGLWESGEIGSLEFDIEGNRYLAYSTFKKGGPIDPDVYDALFDSGWDLIYKNKLAHRWKDKPEQEIDPDLSRSQS